MYIAEKWELRQVWGAGRRELRIERREREKSADVRTNRALYIIVRCIPSYNILRRRAGYIVIL